MPLKMIFIIGLTISNINLVLVCCVLYLKTKNKRLRTQLEDTPEASSNCIDGRLHSNLAQSLLREVLPFYKYPLPSGIGYENGNHLED
jgi:hypothetical protein